MTIYPFNKRCPRGHPIDSDDPCGFCAQEDSEREKQDNKLAEQIARLAEAGKLDNAVLYAFTRLCCRKIMTFDASLAGAIERIFKTGLPR